MSEARDILARAHKVTDHYRRSRSPFQIAKLMGAVRAVNTLERLNDEGGLTGETARKAVRQVEDAVAKEGDAAKASDDSMAAMTAAMMTVGINMILETLDGIEPALEPLEDR